MKNLDLTIFPTINKDQWLQLAEKQLKGANPLEELAWENDAQISLEGYYDSSDTSEFEYLQRFFDSIESHRWKLYEQVDSSNYENTNQNAIASLMGGCDGIILNEPDLDNLNKILADVNSNICDVCLISSEEVKYYPEFSGFKSHPNGNCISSKESTNPINQLFELLDNIATEKYIYRIAHADFFLEIATVRALRYFLESNELKNIHIHSHVPQHNSDEHQWFLNTTAGLASILGGSHSIDLSTAKGDSRISRNIGNLIREESGIELYSDQCGGSYYIEVLTDKIIKLVTQKLKK